MHLRSIARYAIEARSTGLAALLALSLALGACGGSGGDLAAAAGPSARAARVQAQALPTDPALLTEITELMDFAERRFPDFFPTHEANQTLDPYVYRFYPRTGVYLGVDGRTIRVLGGPFGATSPLDVGSLDDYACEVRLSTCVAPSFVQPPASQTVAPGAVTTFGAIVAGGPSIRLQWLRNGVPIGGATLSSFSLTATTADDGARFSVRADNAKGSATSTEATLTVAQVIDDATMRALATSRGCFECHDIAVTRTGPAWRLVAQRYAGQAGAQDQIANSILSGSSRRWGSSAMGPQPVSPSEAQSLAAWILTLR